MAERDRASFWVSRLREHAIAVREEWISGLLSELQASDSGTGVAAAMSDAKVFNALFTAFLFCDLNAAGAATLPPNFKSLHRQVLRGRHVVQVDELVDAAAPAKERYGGGATGTRVLKLALTDGCQQVVGVEYSQMGSLAWDCPAGSKLLLHDVPVRRGLLLLGPGNAVLLGGQVERTEAARQRAVAAWNARAEGRRRGARTLDIFTEARRAAWNPATAAEAQKEQPQGPLPPQPHQQALSAQGQQQVAIHGTTSQAVAHGSRAVAPVAAAPAPPPLPLAGASSSLGGASTSAGHASSETQPAHAQQHTQSQLAQLTPQAEAGAVAGAAVATAAAAATAAATRPLWPMPSVPLRPPSSSGDLSSVAARPAPPSCESSQLASQPGSQPQSGCPRPLPQRQPLSTSLLHQPADPPVPRHDACLGGSNAAQRGPCAAARQPADTPLPPVPPFPAPVPSPSQPPSSQQRGSQQPPATVHHDPHRPWSTQPMLNSQHGGANNGYGGHFGMEVQPTGSQLLHPGSSRAKCPNGNALEAAGPEGAPDATERGRASQHVMPPGREALRQQLLATMRVPQHAGHAQQPPNQGRSAQQPAVSPLPTCLQPSPIPQALASGHQPYRWQQDPGDTQQHQEAGGDLHPQQTSSWEPGPWAYGSGCGGARYPAEAWAAPGGAAERGTGAAQQQRGASSQPPGPAASLHVLSSTQERPPSASQRMSQPHAVTGMQGAGRSSQFLAGLAAYASAGSGSQQPNTSQPGELSLAWSQRPSQQQQQQQPTGAAYARAAVRLDGVPGGVPGIGKAWETASTTGAAQGEPQGAGEGAACHGLEPVGMEEEGQEAEVAGSMGAVHVTEEPHATDLAPFTGLEDAQYGIDDTAAAGESCWGACGDVGHGGSAGKLGGVSSNSLFSLSLALFD